ncbi:MAG: protein kinase [Desulfobacteraceae bacterium]|nr:protein kinase [Desulfobacteraceae bacterium]
MQTIGKYRIRGLLGRGAMSRVYRVEIPTIRKTVALKRLEPDPMLVALMGAEKIRRLFVSEAVTMAGLRHPNVVAVWDFGETQGIPHYLMEHYSHNLGEMIGESYRVERPSRAIPVDKALHYLRGVLSGLACLHYAGIVHRDIKPFNILITEQDTAKICDFGLSKLRGETFAGPQQLKVGSPWYAAPEQEADPNAAGFSADVFSAGVMFYRMLTGVLPMAEPMPPSRQHPDLDAIWDAFILKAIAPNPDARHGDGRQMLAALADLETHWEKRKEAVCRLPPDPPGQSPTAKHAPRILRKTPRKVAPKEALAFFRLDPLWRPLSIRPRAFRQKSAGIILDAESGLVWQTAGTPYPLTWHQAAAYVEHLRAEGFGDRQNWRLPTVDELLTLVTDLPRNRDFCLDPVFDPEQRWAWSADRRSFVAAWCVSFDLGYVSPQDFTDLNFVRAVADA